MAKEGDMVIETAGENTDEENEGDDEWKEKREEKDWVDYCGGGGEGEGGERDGDGHEMFDDSDEEEEERWWMEREE